MMHRLYVIAVIIVGTAMAHVYAILPSPVELACDWVETSEASHVYDGEGRLIFLQLIWWDEHNNCVAWRMVKDGEPSVRRDWRNGGYVSLWKDGDVLREVRSQHAMVTHEQFDRELISREKLPVERRRQLSKR